MSRVALMQPMQRGTNTGAVGVATCQQRRRTNRTGGQPGGFGTGSLWCWWKVKISLMLCLLRATGLNQHHRPGVASPAGGPPANGRWRDSNHDQSAHAGVAGYWGYKGLNKAGDEA
jgi:hypothetical protein